MKEITRIHIAKVAYDIELDAKKDIQKYIAALERYAGDAELLDDIEIRITELLAERGIAAGGVIARDDVAAIRAQLGEPTDFIPEGAGDIAVGEIDDSSRKLYRDRDSAILGGVLAGIARFFRMSPVWTRVIFIVLLFASFGTASIVYLVLWLVVPPARTAAQKLQMRGQLVTLESLKQLGEQGDFAYPAAAVMRRIVRYGVGTILTVCAVSALVATVWAGVALFFGLPVSDMWRPLETWWLALALGLFVLAGLLLSALGFILADATFRKRWSRRIGTSVVVITTVGIVAFMSGIGTMMYGSWQESVHYNSLRKTSKGVLPTNFAHVKKVTVTSADKDRMYGMAAVEYIVSDKPHYELDAMPGVKPQISLNDDGTEATISLKLTAEQTRAFWGYNQVTLKVYGPALETIVANGNAVTYSNDSTQDTLTVHGTQSQLTLIGSYKTVTVASEDTRASVSLDSAAIENLAVKLEAGEVTAGVVRTLTVEAPDVCSVRVMKSDRSRIVVQAVSSNKLTFNGNEQTAKSIDANCSYVQIGLREENGEYED